MSIIHAFHIDVFCYNWTETKRMLSKVRTMFNINKFMRNMREKGTKKGKSTSSHIPFRLNLLFFVVFVLMLGLIARLGQLEIVDKEKYEQLLSTTTEQTIETPSARGMIYDAKGKVLVENVPRQSIVYARGANVTAQTMRDIAIRLCDIVSITPGEVKDRDMIDFYLADKENYKAIYHSLTTKELKNKEGLPLNNAQVYQAVVAKVPVTIYQSPDSLTLAQAFVFTRMNSASQFDTVTITNENLTEDDIARVAERSNDLPGLSTSVDWTRQYTTDDSVNSLLGKVSSIQSDDVKEYLAKGYSLNSRVGVGQLEQQYEEVLQGKPQKSVIETNNNGQITSRKIVENGSKGDNLKLTIDLDFQEKVEQIVKQYMNEAVEHGYGKTSTGAYAVVMNPINGAVYAMVGFDRNQTTGEVTENPLSTFQNAYMPGSVVKGGTLSAGYEAGVLIGNDTIMDTPVTADGTTKASVFNPDGSKNMPLTAIEALQYSSNDYMMKIVIKMLGQEYTPGMTLNYDQREKVFKELRSAYAQYGLGVKTGLDMPQEATGFIEQSMDSPSIMGHLLDESFGQYDTYTPLQLANYVATVANNGKRIIPHLVEGIYDNNDQGGLGDLLKIIPSTVADTVNINAEQMSVIQQGFYQVVHGVNNGLTTATPLAKAELPVSAKTGTAEVPLVDDNGNNTDILGINSNCVAYAPSEQPQIAISVVLPNLENVSTYEVNGYENIKIVRDIVNMYNQDYYSKGITLK